MGLKGFRLWAMGKMISTCSAPPLADGDQLVDGVAQLGVLPVGWNGTHSRVSDWLHVRSI
jgi:hypothetical protein